MRTTSATPPAPARPLNILIGIAGAVLLALTVLVPIAAAASPTSRSERFIMAGGTDVTLPADQSVEVFVVFNGNAESRARPGQSSSSTAPPTSSAQMPVRSSPWNRGSISTPRPSSAATSGR
jgi:hypothetical protein